MFAQPGSTWASARDIRATVLIETILAAFEMDEILTSSATTGRPELRALDYIFSVIKGSATSGFRPRGPALITMTTHFMRSYSLLAIRTCHRRHRDRRHGGADPAEGPGGERAGARWCADKGQAATPRWHVGARSGKELAYRVRRRARGRTRSRLRDDVDVVAATCSTSGPKGPITEERPGRT